MKKKLTISGKTLTLALALVFAMGLAVSAMAAEPLQSINAYLNRGVTVEFNGAAQTFKDANGKVVYPITYEGTTYLPVRAVAGLFDVPVDWDGARNTVTLGKVSGALDLTTKTVQAKANDNNHVIRDKAMLTVQSSEGATQTFTSGVELIFKQYAMDTIYSYHDKLWLELQNRTNVSFTLWQGSKAPVQVDVYARTDDTDHDGTIIASYNLTNQGEMTSKTLDLSGTSYTQICFVAKNGKSGDLSAGEARVFDIKAI